MATFEIYFKASETNTKATPVELVSVIFIGKLKYMELKVGLVLLSLCFNFQNINIFNITEYFYNIIIKKQ